MHSLKVGTIPAIKPEHFHLNEFCRFMLRESFRSWEKKKKFSASGSFVLGVKISQYLDTFMSIKCGFELSLAKVQN